MARSQTIPLLRKLRKALETLQVRQGKVLVAVSGGSDSISLLLGLHEVAEQHGLELVAGHLNHGLRGNESDGDAAFVEQFCGKRSIHCVSESVAPGSLVPGQSHLESRARELRYEWLEGVAQRENCQWVMTGHTADDQAETVLHHVFRGTGLRGLRGIAPKRRLNGSLLIRPLLTVSRAEVKQFLYAREIVARQDSSNKNLRFMRSWLREMIFPLLPRINPDAFVHLARLTERVREVYSIIRRRGRKLLRAAELPAVGDVLVFDQKFLSRADPTTLQEALFQLWSRQDWPVSAMSSKRWREVMQVCRGERPQVQLPAGVVVRQKLNVVHFLRNPGG